MAAPKLRIPASGHEEWRYVPGYEGVYSVSSRGRVRRDAGGPGATAGRILKPTPDKDGYLKTALSAGGVSRDVRVSRLVCEAFHGPAPEGKPFVLHGNGDNTDNTPGNLRWGDGRENQLDAIKHGTHAGSQKTSCLRGHPLDEGNTYLDGKGKRSCKECRRAARRIYARRSKVKGLEPNSPIHGSTNGYLTYGCRCDRCKEAQSNYKRQWRKRRKEVGDVRAEA